MENTAFSGIHDLVTEAFILSADFEIADANAAMLQLVEYTPADIGTIRLDDLLYKSEVSGYGIENVKAASRSGGLSNVIVITRSGRLLRLSFFVVSLTQGGLLCTVLQWSLLSVSEGVQSFLPSQEVVQPLLSADWLQLVLRRFPSAYISVIDRNLRVSYSAGVEFLRRGLNPDDTIGVHINDVFGEFAPMVEAYYLRCFNGEEVDFMLHIDGQHQLYKCVPLSDAGTGVEHILVVVDNVTQLEVAKQALAQSEQHLRSILENSIVGLIMSNPAGKMIYSNAAFSRIVGYSPTELKKLSFEEYSFAPDLEIEKTLLEKIGSGQKNSYTIEKRYVHKTNDLVWVRLDIMAIRNAEGILQSYVGVVENIDGRKKYEAALLQREGELAAQISDYQLLNEEYFTINEELSESNDRIQKINDELRLAKDKAEESDKLKSAFLANMSHEIRTPMNAILGFSNMLANESLPAEKRKYYVDIISGSSSQLLTIIEDIIDISKIEANQMKVDLHQSVFINELVFEIYAMFKPRAESSNIHLYFSQGLNNESSVVKTDGGRLKQIFINLLSNALKFTPAGHIRFGYTLRGGAVEFFVEDTGIGISRQNKELIFERFRQVDLDYSTMKSGGTGLGLSISKALTEMLGGRMWVESDEGVGSVFYFTIPYNGVGVEQVVLKSGSYSNAALQPKILIAEDEDVNYLYIEEVLLAKKLRLIHAKNGREAVDLFAKHPDVAVILMDIKMPLMNGIEAIEIIRKTDKVVPIVAQTAYAYADDRTKILAAGADAILSKPIAQQAIVAIIDKYLEL